MKTQIFFIMGLSTSKLSAFNKLCKIYRKRILNSKKSILKEIPSSELSFIALYQKTITRNSESASFMGLLKSLLACGFWKKPDKLGLCFLSQKL